MVYLRKKSRKRSRKQSRKRSRKRSRRSSKSGGGITDRFKKKKFEERKRRVLQISPYMRNYTSKYVANPLRVDLDQSWLENDWWWTTKEINRLKNNKDGRHILKRIIQNYENYKNKVPDWYYRKYGLTQAQRSRLGPGDLRSWLYPT